MSEIEEFSTLLALIYDSVETPELWQAALQAIGRLPATVSVFRPPSSEDFSDHDVARLRALIPHLQRVMRLRMILNAAVPRAHDIDAVLAAIEKPAVLVDRQARFLHANALGAAALRDGGLMLARGRLSARSIDETGNLHKRIYAAATRSAPVAADKIGPSIVKTGQRLFSLFAPCRGRDTEARIKLRSFSWTIPEGNSPSQSARSFCGINMR